MKKILIIEGDESLGDILNRQLTTEGYTTTLVQDGALALEKIRSFGPDLILLDIILPNMSGYEILEAKLKDPTISPIPVIIISNSGQPVEITRALALGVKDYLVKAQFDPEEVLIKVKAQLRKTGEAFDVATSLEEAMDSNEEVVNLGGKKILWVEDDQFLNDIIARKLSPTNCIFSHASEGQEALEMISKEMPDIVVLDIILPGMDGFEILSKIKNDPKTKHIPVILLSNLGEESDIQKSISLGAARFLIKANITPDEIIDNIKEVLDAN